MSIVNARLGANKARRGFGVQAGADFFVMGVRVADLPRRSNFFVTSALQNPAPTAITAED